jgi:hypothetical protein
MQPNIMDLPHQLQHIAQWDPISTITTVTPTDHHPQYDLRLRLGKIWKQLHNQAACSIYAPKTNHLRDVLLRAAVIDSSTCTNGVVIALCMAQSLRGSCEYQYLQYELTKK